MYTTIAFALAMGAAHATLVDLPATDLAGCQAFVAQFDNTCADAATYDFANDLGEEMQCTGTDMRCPDASGASDYDDSNPCTFRRKLCVSCYTDADGTVMVNVKTNGMPSHCFDSTVNNATPFDSEWNVAW